MEETLKNKHIIEEATELRGIYKDLEKRIKIFKDQCGRTEAGRYVSLAYTELESSRHWLGEALGAAGQKNPYENK